MDLLHLNSKSEVKIQKVCFSAQVQKKCEKYNLFTNTCVIMLSMKQQIQLKYKITYKKKIRILYSFEHTININGSNLNEIFRNFPFFF